jgi:hypothetical protein
LQDSSSFPSIDGPTAVEFNVWDIDNDQDLDYFVVATGRRDSPPEDRQDYLIRAVGTGEMLDQSQIEIESMALSEASAMGFDSIRLDWDEDGDLDLYVVNDQGSTYGGNVLWENRNGTLVDATDDCDCGIVHSAMGVDRADYDGDGDADLYITAIQHNVLLENQGDGRYVDVATATGADSLNNSIDKMSWGAIFLDFDNDGLVDILVSEGDQSYEGLSTDEPVVELPIDLLRQERVDGEVRFIRASEEMGLDRLGFWRTTVAQDFNHDGVLDLLITDASERPLLFISQGCTSNAWIEVDAPIDAEVEICTEESCQVGWVRTDSGWGGSQSPVLHFGLADSPEVYRIGVKILGGKSWIWDQMVESRRIVHWSIP